MAKLSKLAGGVEDLAFGMESVNQMRQGQLVNIQQINSGKIPYSLTMSILEKFNYVDAKILQFDNFILITNDNLFLKADKVIGGTAGNIVSLDAEGNIQDSGVAALIPGMSLIDPAVEDNLVSMTVDGNSADSGFAIADLALVIHTHEISDVNGLQAVLDGKALLVHTHVISDVGGLIEALNNKSDITHNHNGIYEFVDATILRQADIIDTLLSTSIINPLSANQGKVLKALSDAIQVQVDSLNITAPAPNFPADEGLALVARATGNDWEKILGLPLETGNAHKTVTTEGVEGDSFWSPIVTSPNIISEDFAMATGANGSIVSPTINDGVTVTVPDGATLVIL